MGKSKDETEKIIENGYGFSHGDKKNNAGIIKRWAVLGGFFFVLNICFILIICANHAIKSKEETVVMIQGAEAEAETAKKESVKADGKKKNPDKSDKPEEGKQSGKNPDKTSDKSNTRKNTNSIRDEKRVYLTFDDGPSKNTEKVLDILKKHKVKATFFVIGKEDDYSKKMYKRIVEEGHTLGMHSYSHDYKQIYKSKEAFFKDYDKIHKLLKRVTGEDVKYYRFPGGTSNTLSDVPMKTLIKGMNKRKVEYFDWNVMNGDASGKNLTKKQMLQNVLKDVEIHNTSVVLMHDGAGKDKTVEMLPDLLKALKKMKTSVLPIDEDTPLVQHVKKDS